MTRVSVKNMPRLHLSHLLRRRKRTLESFVRESGIQTYSSLLAQCASLGVQPPTQKEYEKVFPEQVNTPAEGVVVVEPMPVIDDLTGSVIDPDAPLRRPGIEVVVNAVEKPEKPEKPEEPEESRFGKSRKKRRSKSDPS